MRIICDTFQNMPFICIPENIFFDLWIKRSCILVLKGFQDVISRFYSMLVVGSNADFVLFCLCRFFKEALACVLAGILGMPLGVIQFLPVYHPLHDSNNVHTEVCVFLQMSVYVMITWAGDRQAAAKRHELQGKEKEKKKSKCS